MCVEGGYCWVLHIKRAREDVLLSHGVLPMLAGSWLPMLVGSWQHLNAWAKMRRVLNLHNKFLGPQ